MSRSRYALFCGVFLIVVPAWTQSATPALKKGDNPSAAVSQPRVAPSVFEITMETSRSQPTPGTGLEVMAQVRNLTSGPLTITNYGSRLVIPPEITLPDNTFNFIAFIPGALAVAAPALKGYDPLTALTLNSGESGSVFWFLVPQGASQSRASTQFFSELQFLFFQPGDYHIAAQIQYWIDPAEAKNAMYTFWDTAQPGAQKFYEFPHNNGKLPQPAVIPAGAGPAAAPSGNAVQTATVHLVTPQFVVLFGAAIGGLFAFILRAQLGIKRVNVSGSVAIALQAGKVVSAGLAAMLFSIIITILLNRVSESQFLIRVTIADLWGAIAVGFIVSFTGSEQLAKLLGKSAAREAASARSGHAQAHTEVAVTKHEPHEAKPAPPHGLGQTPELT